jgi:hypothetical protein
MNPYIPYVQSVASQDVPPPYQFPGVTVNAFVWQIEMGPVQAYCDTYFNLGTPESRGFSYEPASFWPYATLLFIDYPVMISTSRPSRGPGPKPPYSDRGIISQREVFVAVPVVRRGLTPGAGIVGSTVEWALPFIVVGNPMSAVCGREMLGMGKLLADIELAENTFPGSFLGRVNLPGWQVLDPGFMQKVMTFVEVTTAPALPTFRGSPEDTSPWTLLQSREGGWLVDSLAIFADFIETATVGMAPAAMRTVALKQFRDALEPGKALYQALVSCRCKYSNISRFQFYNENDVRIRFNDTGSFGEILRTLALTEGPPTNRKLEVTPKAAYRFNADINFDQMRTIYTFPMDRGPNLPPIPASGDLASPWFRSVSGFFGERNY